MPLDYNTIKTSPQYSSIIMWLTGCLAFRLPVHEQVYCPTSNNLWPQSTILTIGHSIRYQMITSPAESQSKTDSCTRICPINAIMPSLACKEYKQHHQLSITKDGKHLTQQLLSSNLDTILQKVYICRC